MPTTRSQRTLFAGIIPIYLRTLTTTYPFLEAGWQWSPNSLLPMEFEHYATPLVGTLNGFQAQTIDIAQLSATGGYSKTVVGSLTGSITAFALNPFAWVGNQLMGWQVQGGELQPAVASYYLPLDGTSHAYALGGVQALNLPNLANTGTPAPGAGCNWLTLNGGVYSSNQTTLNISSAIWNVQFGIGSGISNVPNATNGLVWPTNARFNACIPYAGFNNILTDDTVGGTAPYQLVQTDFATFAANVLCTMQNPVSTTLDINALFQTAANTEVPTATYAGWLYIYNDTQTFNGIAMNGYGILVAPDFSSYVILNILPIDATAANWNDSGAAKIGKVDRSGALLIKKFTNNGTIFAGTALSGPAIPFPIKQTPPINLAVNPGLYK